MKQHFNTIIIAIVVIIAAAILGGAWKKSRTTNETINVTGLAKQDFVSDLIVWRGYFSAKSKCTKEAYAKLKKDAETIKKYLISKGVKEKDIVFSSVNIEPETYYQDEQNNQDYEYNDNNYYQSKSNYKQPLKKFKGYILTQSVKIESKEVDKVEKISRESSELIDLEIELTSYSPEYYYTKLADLKIELLSMATKDARNRAIAIAKNAKSGLGSLKRADMGVFQITAQNSSEDSYSYGGTFNTYSKNKTASITVHLDFKIR